jgi:hypothetical protein
VWCRSANHGRLGAMFVRAAPEVALSNVYHTSFGVPVMDCRSYYVLTMAHCGTILSVTNAMGFLGAQASNGSQFTDGPGFGVSVTVWAKLGGMC